MPMGDGDMSGLNDRKKLILKAIIEAHVKVGEPVGSRYLSQNKQIFLSSATIRNEMAELEELGYLKQPHTSAGRIPSERGYRLYVNSLMQNYSISTSELNRINSMLKRKISELHQLLETTTALTSSLTNYAALAAIKPQKSSVVVSQFRLMQISSDVFLLIMMMNTDAVKTRKIHAGYDIDAETLTRLETALNAHIVGMPADGLTVPVMVEMENSIPECEGLISPIIKCVYEAIGETDGGDIKFSGINRLLQYPEYSESGNFGDFLGLLESKDDIMKILSKADENKVNVFIGSENSVDVMKNSSLVFKPVKRGGRSVGAIGVIGPCRMDYSKVISTVDCLANILSDRPETDDAGKNHDKI